MRKSNDEKMIQDVADKITKDNQTAIAMMCIGLADPKEFKSEFEWSFCLGKLFSIMMEGGFYTKNEELLYNEAGESIVDEKISSILSKCNVLEKTNILAFLTTATKPVTQNDVDFLVDQLKKNE